MFSLIKFHAFHFCLSATTASLAGFTGTLRLARTASDLELLLAAPPTDGEPIALLLDARLATAASLRAIRAASSSPSSSSSSSASSSASAPSATAGWVAGVAILAAADCDPRDRRACTAPTSDDARSPLAAFAPNAAAASFVWNPAGAEPAAADSISTSGGSNTNTSSDGLIADAFRFGLVRLGAADSARLLALAAANEASVAAGDYAARALEFQYRMGAQADAVDCLARATCLPLGGFSVWSVLAAPPNASAPLPLVPSPSAPADTRPIVAAVAALDALSLFHAAVPRVTEWPAAPAPVSAASSSSGSTSSSSSSSSSSSTLYDELGAVTPASDAVVSGLVTLLAAAHALGAAVRAHSLDLAALPRRIAFFAFAGEAFGLLGSRSLLADITGGGFRCEVPISAEHPERGCARPYVQDLAFQRVLVAGASNNTGSASGSGSSSASASGSVFAAVLELRQVGWFNASVTFAGGNATNSTLYAHTQPQQRASHAVDEALGAVNRAAASLASFVPPPPSHGGGGGNGTNGTAGGGSSGSGSGPRSSVKVLPASADTPSVPPGSAWAFLAANASTPVVTLADHAREYANAYFHSDADTGALSVPHLCNAASLAARALLLMAGGGDAANATVNALFADCTVVDALVACLLRGEKSACERIATVGSSATDVAQRSTFYTSVFFHKQQRYIGSLSRFVHAALAAFTATRLGDVGGCDSDAECATSLGFVCGGRNQCALSETHFHQAVDPALRFDYDAFLWRPANASASGGGSAGSALWTESNWAEDVGVRAFTRETPTLPWTLLLFGATVSMLTATATFFGQRYCRRHLKMA